MPESVKLDPQVHALAARLAFEQGRKIKETIRIALELLDEKERIRESTGTAIAEVGVEDERKRGKYRLPAVSGDNACVFAMLLREGREAFARDAESEETPEPSRRADPVTELE